MYALIQKSDNQILRVAQEGVTLANEKPFYWGDCPDDVTTAWTYDGSQFISPSVIPPTPEEIQEKINNDARAYLNSTDWYVVRLAETGVEIPKDILITRQKARESII